MQPEDGLACAADLAGLISETHPEISIGGACFPEVHPEAASLEADIAYLKTKVDNGATFLITQLFFDNRAYFDFVPAARAAGIEVPIIPGIMPMTSFKQIGRICELCEANIPGPLSEAMEAAGGDERVEFELGVAYAAQQCAELLRAGAPGIHFYALNRWPATRAILAALRAARPWEERPTRPVAAQAAEDRPGSSINSLQMPDFDYQGHRISYDEYGEGDRPLVLIHGLLMNRHMFDRLAPAMAERGNRVITVDLLGHGQFGPAPGDDQLLDVVLRPAGGRVARPPRSRPGGDRRNVAGRQHEPHRGQGRARPGAGNDDRDAGAGQRADGGRGDLHPDHDRPALRRAPLEDRGRGHQPHPARNFFLDIGLDWLRQDPEPSLAVLEGLFLGASAPHHPSG